MFGVGWTEMLVIGVVALIVIGPKDLPVVMNRLGKMVSTIRRLGSEFQSEINKTTGLDQITDLRRSITEPLKSVASEITRDFNRTTPAGTVEPTGIIAPKTEGSESVVAEIHEKIGTVAPVKHVESPAPVEAIAPATAAAAPKPRKPRARKVVAAAGPVEESSAARRTLARDEAAVKPVARKPRARKPKVES